MPTAVSDIHGYCVKHDVVEYEEVFSMCFSRRMNILPEVLNCDFCERLYIQHNIEAKFSVELITFLNKRFV
jgi:hypothetical protein